MIEKQGKKYKSLSTNLYKVVVLHNSKLNHPLIFEKKFKLLLASINIGLNA